MKRGSLSHEEADERRETVIASAPSLRPNFKPKTGITESQLSKFQELHRRRLQIKAKSKIQKRDKGANNGKGKMVTEIQDQDATKPTADSDSTGAENLVSEVDGGKRNAALKTRQKLFWGLDTKERWERKSNM